MADFKANPSYVGPRRDMLELVPREARRVMDLGCSTGSLGYSIKQLLDAEVIGVELVKEYAESAQTKLDQVLNVDLDTKAGMEAITDLGRFDCIILADVLEHLKEPEMLLRCIVEKCLSPGGTVLLSVPNVSHWDTLFNLIFLDLWPRRERGIHDRTHLHYFTRKNIANLASICGLEIKRWSAKYKIVEWRSSVNNYAKMLRFIPFRRFFVFQYRVQMQKPVKPQAPN